MIAAGRKLELNEKQKKRIAMYIAYMVFLVLVTMGGIGLMVGFGIDDLNPMWTVTVTIDIVCIFICDILMMSCAMENSEGDLNLKFVQLVVFLCTNLFFDMCCWFFDGHAQLRELVVISNMLYYMFNTLIPAVFMDYIFAELELTGKKMRREWVVYMLCFISIVELVVNYFYPWLFTVNEQGQYARTSIFMLNLIPAYVCSLIIIITAVQYSKNLMNRLVVFSYLLFPIIGLVVQSNIFGLSISMPCIMLSVVLIYTQLHLNRKKKLAEQDIILSQQSVALMVSQMQPHFLYNVLTTISNLCRVNPEEAEEVTVKFSRYLRANLDAMRRTDLIPFDSEMRHINIYLELEKKRFGDRLNYEFDIKERDFLIPALSIQPIVENSVKHGICDKGEPGTLKLSTYSDEQNYYIVVEDDGVGFDPLGPAPDDGRSHVGMTNTKNRLAQMCNAKTEVISSVGNGCKTTIMIPRKKG